MLFEMMIFTLMVLIFCFFTTTFVIRTMISVLNAFKPDDVKEIKVADIIKKPEKKPKKSKYELFLEEQEKKQKERYETLMRNINAYDGTEFGQEEVN